jgi:hypothetical protein
VRIFSTFPYPSGVMRESREDAKGTLTRSSLRITRSMGAARNGEMLKEEATMDLWKPRNLV